MIPLKDVRGECGTASLTPCSLKTIYLTLCFSVLAAGIAYSQEKDTVIELYTGSLLGYYRIEPVRGAPALTPVSTFIAALNKQQSNLLLGMGDNFGPEFGASIQLAGEQPCYMIPNPLEGREKYPASLYKDDDRITQVGTMRQCSQLSGARPASGLWFPDARTLCIRRGGCAESRGWLPMKVQIQATLPLIKNNENQLYMLGANLRVTAVKGLHSACTARQRK